MIKGIQIKAGGTKKMPISVHYLKRPIEFTVDCSMGSFYFTANQLEKYLFGKRKKPILVLSSNDKLVQQP